MTLDYRKGAPPRPRKRGSQPRGTCAFWFLVGAILGAFGVGVAWMTDEQQPAMQTAGPPGTVDAESAQKPTFDFSNLLKEDEVVIPVERAPEPIALPPPPGQQPTQQSQPAKTAKATPPRTSAGPNSYILQVGSFRKNSDAEKLKAQLAMLGIQTNIQTVTIKSGQTYHRVRTGSYAKADATALRSRLKSNGHNPMMMKAR